MEHDTITIPRSPRLKASLNFCVLRLNRGKVYLTMDLNNRVANDCKKIVIRKTD